MCFLSDHGTYDVSICTLISAGMTASAMLVTRKRRIDEANKNARAEVEVEEIKNDPDVECHTCSTMST